MSSHLVKDNELKGQGIEGYRRVYNAINLSLFSGSSTDEIKSFYGI